MSINGLAALTVAFIFVTVWLSLILIYLMDREHKGGE